MAYKNYLLTLLLLLVVFNYVDRLALGILMQDIKEDLSLTDTQLGFLTGLAFAVFYSIMGIPIARWADRGNRVTIISATAALWSVAVALCGAAGSFVQLLLIRVGVAVGEAGCVPPAYSLIADYFSRSERPRAAAIYGLGGPIAALVGYFAAGWLNELYGWRMTFVILGLPGVGLALLAWLTLKEPRLTRHDSSPQTRIEPPVEPTMQEVASTLLRSATFRQLLICLSVMFFFLYGINQWTPAFLIRSYDVASGELGMWLTLVYGPSGLIGVLLGGELSSRYAAQRENLQLAAMAGAVALAGALGVGMYIVDNLYVCLSLIFLHYLFLSTVGGPLFATIQTLVPERMRAVAFAGIYFCANLIGMGLGPLATGALSDLYAARFGEESLRLALITLSPGYLWVAWHAWRASRTAQDDIQRNGAIAPLS